MAAPSTTRDPRSVITPEAFHVAEELLGTQLASPRRRLAAILLDLVFIAILTLVTRSFALVLGVVVSAALLRASFRRTEVVGSVFDRARRLSIGCLGLSVGLITLLVFAAVMINDLPPSVERDEDGIVVDFGSGRIQLDDPEDADAELMEPRDADAIREGVTLYSTEEALEAYAELLRSGSDTDTDRELREALEARLATAVAADTLAGLAERVADLQDDLRREELRREALEDELEDAESGFVDWLAGLADELGFGFGWAALYTTVLLSTMKGQTLGKRMMGIRVVRLDGKPINWWVAFERAGGYAAGFATGLLGFFQVYWDSNRQAIHDRIVGTVVVREGAEHVQDWEEAL